ncbi:MAG: adenylate kinase family protein [Halopenitus sp.]
MKLAVTGTPGTGKTSAMEHLEDEYDVIHLNDRIKDDDSLWIEQDEERGGSLVADLDAIAEELDDWSGILESHLAHYFDADDVVVLRATPEQIETRLLDRGESEATARENAESEALDVILTEAVEEHGEDHVYEIDTSDLTPEEVAAEIERVIEGDREPSAGEVDFMGYL